MRLGALDALPRVLESPRTCEKLRELNQDIQVPVFTVQAAQCSQRLADSVGSLIRSSIRPYRATAGREQIEERVDVAAGSMRTNSSLLMLCSAIVTIHRGWLLF